jgi:2'-5' RNA ligase
VAEFEAAEEQLVTACRDVRAFEVELAEFRPFRHRRGNYTIWLRPKPEARLVDLQTVVQQAVIGTRSRSPRQVFQPHLSVGQVRDRTEMLRPVNELQADWQTSPRQPSAEALLFDSGGAMCDEKGTEIGREESYACGYLLAPPR